MAVFKLTLAPSIPPQNRQLSLCVCRETCICIMIFSGSILSNPAYETSTQLTAYSASLPDLYSLAPSLQALVLCRDPSTHTTTTSASLSLPMIQAVGPSYNHFVKLGLLHPLGGGKFPLDALVVVDTKGRRRLVLPFGWGAGRHASTAAGRIIQDRLMKLLLKCIQDLVEE
jgi:hypothetical protein